MPPPNNPTGSFVNRPPLPPSQTPPPPLCLTLQLAGEWSVRLCAEGARVTTIAAGSDARQLWSASAEMGEAEVGGRPAARAAPLAGELRRGLLRLYSGDASNGRLLRSLDVPCDVRALTVHGGHVYAGGADGSIWRQSEGMAQPAQRFELGVRYPITCLTVEPAARCPLPRLQPR